MKTIKDLNPDELMLVETLRTTYAYIGFINAKILDALQAADEERQKQLFIDRLMLIKIIKPIISWMRTNYINIDGISFEAMMWMETEWIKARL